MTESPYLLVRKQIPLHDIQVSKNLQMLVAPVPLELLDARARLAVQQEGQPHAVLTDVRLCRSFAHGDL